MTLDERAVMRWLMLSERERQRSPMGPPVEALRRIAVKLRGKQRVDKRLVARSVDIFALADSSDMG